MAISEYDRFEQKKVQEVKGSYYIYLPKNWCTKYGVAEQKKVFLRQLADDSLLIRSNSNALEFETQYIINLDLDMERDKEISKEEYVDYLFNLYLTAYIIGYRTIILKKRTKIPLKIKNRIHKITRKLYGMVVISETEEQIVVEEHLDEIDLRILSKQLLTKVGLLMDNYVELVEELTDVKEIEEMVDEIIEQDNQIDEHRYAIERYVHQILIYPTLGRTINVTSVECLHYSENTRLIERIGDHITKLAKLLKIQPIHDKKFVIDHLHGMVKYFHTIQDYYWRKDSLKFFALTRDIKEYSDEVKDFIYQDHPDTEYLIPIRRVCNICGDIAEIRINDILSRQQAKETQSHNNEDKV